MKLADSNVWLALALTGHEHHPLVSAWFRSQDKDGGVVFSRVTQIALMRLLTTRAVMSPYGISPMSNRRAWDLCEELLSNRKVGFVSEPHGVEATWQQFATVSTPSPKLWMDAYLAAFANAGNLQLVTLDAGFTQFPGLRCEILTQT